MQLTRLLTPREQRVVMFLLAVILIGGMVMRVRHSRKAATLPITTTTTTSE